MKNRSNFSRFNDGVVQIYREKARLTDFSARQNVTELDNMEFVARLDFEEMSKRQQDQEFAENAGFSLSMKIHTRLAPGVESQCKAVIGSTLYDISYIDKTRTDMFLYLEEVRKIAS